jgi:phosphonatase-like hydrolase
MIELVVFDMAGTTVFDGDAVNASFRAALASKGIDAESSLVNTVMGLHKPEAIRILLTSLGRLADDAQVDAIHADFVSRMRDYYAHDPAVREIPGASAAFATLRRAGAKVALNTGFNRSIVDVILNRLGWSVPAVIDATVSSDEVAHGRPHPDMIQHLMTQLGVRDARNVAKVGDTKVDMEEGHNAGCGLVIGVLTGSDSAEKLRQSPHTHLTESVAAIPRLVQGAISSGGCPQL